MCNYFLTAVHFQTKPFYILSAQNPNSLTRTLRINCYGVIVRVLLIHLQDPKTMTTLSVIKPFKAIYSVGHISLAEIDHE